jgi:hypothetical protein
MRVRNGSGARRLVASGRWGEGMTARAGKRPPARGDLVQIDWVDIYEDPIGDPEKAALKRRTSYAVFWDRHQDASGLEAIVTTTTVDEDVPAQQGFCIYPAACVVGLRVIKRARRARAKPRA